MADNTLKTRITLEGGDEIRRRLEEIAKAGDKAGTATGESIHGANAGLGDFSQNIRSVITLFDEFERGQHSSFFATLGARFKEGLEGAHALGVGIAALAGAFVGLAVHGAAVASEIKEASLRVGTSAESFSKLKFAIEQSGGGAEGFERAMAVIGQASADAARDAAAGAAAMTAAQKKLTDAQDAFTKGLVDAAEARNLTIEKATQSHNDRMADLVEKQQKDFKDAFDKGGVDLIALQEEQDQQIADEKEKSKKELDRTLRDLDQQQARDRIKAFEVERDAIVKFNEEIAAAAEKASGTDISGVASGSGQAAKFKALGVELLDLAGKARDPAEVFRGLAEKIAAIADPAQRASVAVDVLGRRAGPHLVESLSEGRKGLEELGKEAERLGLIFSASELEIGKKFGDTLAKLGDTLTATSARIGLVFAPLFTSIGEALAEVFGNVQPTIIAAMTKVATTLKPIFDDLALAIRGEFGKINSKAILVLAIGVRAFGRAVIEVFDAIKPTILLIGDSFDSVAKSINSLFGTNLTAVDIPLFVLGVRAVLAVLTPWRTILLLLLPAIQNINTEISNFAKSLGVDITPQTILAAEVMAGMAIALGSVLGIIPLVTGAFSAFRNIIGVVTIVLGAFDLALLPLLVVGGLIVAAVAAMTLAIAPLEDTKAAIDKLFGEGTTDKIQALVVTIVDDLVGAIKQFGIAAKTWFDSTWFGQLINGIIAGVEKLIGWIKDLIAFAKKAADAIASLGSGANTVNPGVTDQGVSVTGEPALAAASGGLIRGPGTGTSDSIRALLSNGEFVVNARATSTYLPLLRAINSMRGFSLGGLAERLGDIAVPRRSFASGGLALAGAPAGASGRPVVINLPGGGSFNLRGDDDVVDALERKARAKTVESGGRKPSWHWGR